MDVSNILSVAELTELFASVSNDDVIAPKAKYGNQKAAKYWRCLSAMHETIERLVS